MKKYIYQDFLLKCPYTKIKADDVLWNGTECIQDYHEPYNLFDLMYPYMIRYIKLSELDSTIDTLEDFASMVTSIGKIDILVIRNDRPPIHNAIVALYSEATLKAYIYYFQNNGLHCFVDKFYN